MNDGEAARPTTTDRSSEERRRTQDRMASHIAETVEELKAIEARDRATMSLANRLAETVSRRSGSLWFVLVHVAWFGVWLGLNIPAWGLRFDPFPFGLLTTIVSLEAILLSVFILMSENRQAERDERQAKVDLEVNLVAEREVTKIIAMLSEVQRHLGIVVEDSEVQQMNEPTKVEDLVEAAEALAPSKADTESEPDGRQKIGTAS